MPGVKGVGLLQLIFGYQQDISRSVGITMLDEASVAAFPNCD